jgi:hypothetical protein
VLLKPGGEVRERREKLRDHYVRPFHVGDFDHFRGGGRIECGDVREQALAILRRPDIEVMHHDHASERELLRDLTPRAVFGQALQDAVLCGKFSACHQPGRTGTLTASPPQKPSIRGGTASI